jgi:hypothetical protein
MAKLIGVVIEDPDVRAMMRVEGDETVRREHAASLLMIAFRPPSARETPR